MAGFPSSDTLQDEVVLSSLSESCMHLANTLPPAELLYTSLPECPR